MNSDTPDACEELFAAIGKYVVLFQWLEGIVDQCLLLLWGHENWAESQYRLAKMKNSEKLDVLLREFRENPANARGRTRPDWVARFETLIQRLHEERQRRNSLLHSQYLFHFVDIGLPVLQSDRRRQGGEVNFEQKDLSPEAQRILLDDLGRLAIDMNFAHVQLVHDYGAATPNLLRP